MDVIVMKTIFDPYKKRIPELTSIKITEEAFKKANTYASLVSEIIGEDKECVGTLMNYQDRKDNLARDIHLWKNQVVTSASGLFGEPLDDCIESKKRGMETIGLWHSHGRIGVFHSSDDKSVLRQMYSYIKNKIVTNEKEKGIECIVEGETVRLFEEGSNKELKLKINGNIEDIKYIERDYCHVLNSIVINKNSYSKNTINPKSGYDYDAEVWAGYNKKEYKRTKHASIELVDETNNIQLDKEELAKEVGEKVIFQGSYLKDMPNYSKVLAKYQQVTVSKKHDSPSKQKISSINQIVEPQEDLTDKKRSLNNIVSSIPKTNSKKGYHSQVFDFYTVKKSSNNDIISTIGLIGEIFAGDYQENGKKYWLWEDRIKKVEEVYSQINGKVCKEQHAMLENLVKILNSNYYAKKKHGVKLKKMCKKMGVKNKLKVKKTKGILSKILRKVKK